MFWDQGVVARWLWGLPWIIPWGRTGLLPVRVHCCISKDSLVDPKTILFLSQTGLYFLWDISYTAFQAGSWLHVPLYHHRPEHPFPSMPPTSVLCKTSPIVTDSASLQTTALPKELCAPQPAPQLSLKRDTMTFPQQCVVLLIPAEAFKTCVSVFCKYWSKAPRQGGTFPAVTGLRCNELTHPPHLASQQRPLIHNTPGNTKKPPWRWQRHS